MPGTIAAPAGPDTTAPELSLLRLYLLRLGYLVLGGGLAVVKWPEMISASGSWSLWQGVANSMFVALSLLALVGLRYPVTMLPVLLFEAGWKVIWLTVVALPLWTSGRVNEGVRESTYECLGVLFVLLVIPWRYVAAQYAAQRGDRWRPDPSRRADVQP